MKKRYILLTIILGFFFICYIGYKFTSSLFQNSMNIVNADIEREIIEEKRIKELTEINGIIITDDFIINPVTKNKTNFYSFQFTAKQRRIRNSTGSFSRENFFYVNYPSFLIDYPKKTKLLVKNKLYDIDFNKVIISQIGKYKKDKKGLLTQKLEIFNTDYNRFSLSELSNFDHLDSIRKEMKNRFRKLKGKNEVIDHYLVENNVKPIHILLVNEYNFNSGDTITFKGKIVNDKIIPLF